MKTTATRDYSVGPRSLAGWSRVEAWARVYGVVLLMYLAATWLTGAHFMADTIWYAQQAAEGFFWEAGHLLWRPLGWLVWQAFSPLTTMTAGSDPAMNIVVAFIGISWVAGLVSVFSLHSLLRRFVANELVVNVTTVTFIFAQAFLNYAQAGASYGSALALLLFGLYMLSRAGLGPGRFSVGALLAGASFALAVGMWLPFVVAMPAAIVAPLLLFGWDKRRLWLVLQAGAACALVGALVYGLVILHLGLDDLGAIRNWILKTSRNSTTGGPERMIFGFARSFINMGQDGVLFKRFLYNDPYNPVSPVELVRLGMWKFILFYGFLGVVALNLLRSGQGRRVLGLFALAAVPVLGFAVYWQGGDMERYLSLYPLFFLAMACSLAVERSLPFVKYVAAVFVAVLIVSNVSVMANSSLERRQEVASGRIAALLPELKPNSMVMALVQQDDVWQFNHSFPFNPIFQHYGEFVDELPSTRWQQRFSTQVLEIWAKGGDMWFSKRMLADKPQADWNWVEGVDKQRSWSDITGFFTQLETGASVGGEDGFVLIERSAANERLLRGFAEQK